MDFKVRPNHLRFGFDFDSTMVKGPEAVFSDIKSAGAKMDKQLLRLGQPVVYLKVCYVLVVVKLST